MTDHMVKTFPWLFGCGLLSISLLSCAHEPQQHASGPVVSTSAAPPADTSPPHKSAESLTTLPTAPKDNATVEAYLIGAEDVLEVNVWKNADLSKLVIVRPDGKISLPLIGELQAAGITALQLNEEITERLKAFHKGSPDVSVIVQQVNSYVIYLLGEVARPGQFVVKRGTTFIQAIALAGGFTPFASTNNVLVLRKGGENNGSAVRIRYKDIVSGKGLYHNILLKPEDTIIIP